MLRLTMSRVMPRVFAAVAATPLCAGWAAQTSTAPLTSRRCFATATRVARCRPAPSVQDFDVRNVHAFPPHSAAAAAKLIQKLNALRDKHTPTITAETEDVEMFLMMWSKKKQHDVLAFLHNRMMSLLPVPPLMAASEFLDAHLNSSDPAGMALAERDEDVEVLTSFIRNALGGDLPKTELARVCSTRGSGKTQLLKHCLLKVAAEAIVGGGVLVVECGMPKAHFSAAMSVLEAKKTLKEAELHTFVVALIRAHLEKMRIPFKHEGIKTIPDAYKEWSRVTGCKRPLMVFDTVESLPQTTSIKRWYHTGNRGFVEALAYLMARQHGLLVVGTKRVETLDITDPTNIMKCRMARERLPALTHAGYLKALRDSWDRRGVVGGAGNMTTRCLHYLSGGSPRLLRLVSHKTCVAIDPLCAKGWGKLLDDLQSRAAESMNDREMPAASKTNYTMWALAALASGTRVKVPLHKPMPLLPGTTWGDATKGLLFATSSDYEARAIVRVPPILTLDERVGDTFAALRDKTDSKTSPAGCDPKLSSTWPRGLDVSFLHVAIPTKSLRALTFCGTGASKRGVPYATLVCQAMVGRWYLLHLLQAAVGKKKASTRVGLSDVLGCDDAALKGVTVDFSGGIKTTADQRTDKREGTTMYRCVSGHHDLEFAAFRPTKGGGEEAIAVCVQCRRGAHSSKAEIEAQCYHAPGQDGGKLVDTLLVINPVRRTSAPKVKLGCNIVYVTGSAMCDDGALFVHDAAVATTRAHK